MSTLIKIIAALGLILMFSAPAYSQTEPPCNIPYTAMEELMSKSQFQKVAYAINHNGILVVIFRNEDKDWRVVGVKPDELRMSCIMDYGENWTVEAFGKDS